MKKLDGIDQKLSCSLKPNTKRRRKRCLKFTSRFSGSLKEFFVLLGLILFGSYLTIKARYFPEEKPIKIVTKDLKIGETYQADGVELTFKNIELTEKEMNLHSMIVYYK